MPARRTSNFVTVDARIQARTRVAHCGSGVRGLLGDWASLALRAAVWGILAVGWGLAIPELGAESPKVDFVGQIQPILEQNCLKCHTRGKFKGGFSLESRQSVLAGGETGPAAVAGRPDESLLVDLISGKDPDRVMPENGARLSAEQVALVRTWIEQGMPWPAEVSFGFRRAAIEPRRPKVPAAEPGAALSNPIDLILQPYFRQQRIDPVAAVSDRVFARRVFLDLVGLLPTVAQLTEFESDPRPDKHRLLVTTLLDSRQAYADHWLTFWNDLLRNAYRGTGFIDGGREPITDWLYQSLHDNKPYDRFVHELISPVAGSGGFTKGIVWRGVVNASQTPPVQAAQNLSQVFLGTNLKCASCHDSFVNHWKLSEAYALAAVFADKPLEIHRCDKPTGTMAQVGFIYPQLGTIDPAAPRTDRMKQLADLLTKPENGRLTRTIVNRLWAQMLGRGIVEPLDDLDQIPWSADLLDWLAGDLTDHAYDLKHTLTLICTSHAYQRPATGLPKPGEDPGPFTGPLVKRMSAEQFVDAVCELNGVTDQSRPAAVKPRGRDLPAVAGGPAATPIDNQFVQGPAPSGAVRSSLGNDDALLRMLGRPNREQVVTRRESIGTTLQALELTNGEVLDKLLRQGADTWLASQARDSNQLIDAIYLAALARLPLPAERDVAGSLIGSPPTREGVTDLLWAVLMLPEFQLIY